ncbi:MAG: FHA domain-containing protein [Planctomycetes bacterium]|nr:FHA domain-containing protein [Planctomycetota bacterium]
MKAQLVPLDGSPPIEITKDMTLVGRTEECDVRLDHKSVSKLHCILVKTDGLLLLRDLGSTNGTRVNGQRVRRAALLPNDHLTIARFKFRVSLGPDAPSEEHTQRLEAGELVKLLKKAEPSEVAAKPSKPSDPPLWPNPLPDVYPDDESEKEEA